MGSLGPLGQDAGCERRRGERCRRPPSHLPPSEALNNAPLASPSGCNAGKVEKWSARHLPRPGEGVAEGIGRECPLGRWCGAGRWEGLRPGARLERAPPRRVAPARGCCGRQSYRLSRVRGWETRSLPAAPITSSCFCLAQRRPVCPSPQLLPGLDLLAPLPSLPRLPASSAAAAAPRRCSSAVTRAGSGLQDGGGREEGEHT